ncbi:MAG TPA: metal-dependent hydrolase [Candidatus Paceibacterota bacterium]|nr:metal-dependent hydrolase [Candidatus Paceibacterota bacterium]
MFIDLLLGFIIGTLTGFITTGEFYYPYVGAALLFSLLPDIDFLIYHSYNEIDRMSHCHRRILHYPLVYIPIGAIIVTLFSLDPTYGILFIVVSLAHFIHDTGWIGYGVQWAYPLRREHYFFGKKTNTALESTTGIYSDTPENVDRHAQIHGDDNWLLKKVSKVRIIKK